ncbi:MULTISPECIES: alpha/beta fold hydrolase [Staphylococcus]|jgi:esterase|uniref:Alpha/beta hydrolase n=1 Tax=Staphylococcus nepalensis TaxID=214473 RepID=A0A2T4SB12_9STAP|nr:MULTISPECIES: alpha/beta hydrolase [Staphylococcus]MBO1222144.1 alpha/beta hydrolase [Staphylococcus nepalensis]MCY1037286.1 alpha/beta hydrolase [Staphylococcus nepalensis]MDR5648640.1 alpha/beta hydrolase [Staphylococcus nepalensis]MDW8553300.1 alpha/beta hydrolase [Staphylococcus nepalensis]PTK59212.1 alpha/beta hydrolase [Staphylococcus nepalensis]
MNLFTTSDGIALNYKTSGEGKAIVMIHTAFDNFSVFQGLEAKFNHAYQVVLIDLRGHGYSDKPTKINFKTYAKDIKELLDYLYISECSIIAHELGGSIAALFTAQYPDVVTSLTMVNPTLLNDITPEERLYRKYADKIRNWDGEAQQKFLDKQLYYSKRKAKKFLKQVEYTNSMSTKSEIEAVKESFIDNNVMNYLKELKAPTLIVVGQHGERTTVFEAKEVADYIGDTRFEVFEASGLYPFVEEKDKFMNHVAEFIKQQVPSVA